MAGLFINKANGVFPLRHVVEDIQQPAVLQLFLTTDTHTTVYVDALLAISGRELVLFTAS